MTTSLHERARNSKRVGDLCERVIIEIYSRLLTANSIGVDGGANVGWHTVGMAALTTSGHIYAVEPLPVIAAILRQRVEKLRHIVTVLEAALSDHAGRSEFIYFDGPNSAHPSYPHWNSGYSALVAPPRHLAMSHQTIEVEVTTIDKLFAQPPPRLDFIKLDLEGGEYHAMKGGVRTISRLRPFIVFEDGGASHGRLYGYDVSQFTAMVAAMDYDFCDALGDRYTAENWMVRDRWRPFYSFAIPREWQRWPLIQEAIAAAVQHFGTAF
jgi:FkbM family methyltransferase